MASDPLQKALTGIKEAGALSTTVSEAYETKFRLAERTQIEQALRFPGYHSGEAEKRRYIRGVLLVELVYGKLQILGIGPRKTELLQKGNKELKSLIVARCNDAEQARQRVMAETRRIMDESEAAFQRKRAEHERERAELQRKPLEQQKIAMQDAILGVPPEGTIALDDIMVDKYIRDASGPDIQWRRYFQSEDRRAEANRHLRAGFCLALVYQWLQRYRAEEDFFAFVATADALKEAVAIMKAQSARLVADRQVVAAAGSFERVELEEQRRTIETRQTFLAEKKGLQLDQTLTYDNEAAPEARIDKAFGDYPGKYFAFVFFFDAGAHILGGCSAGGSRALFDPNFGQFKAAGAGLGRWRALLNALFEVGKYKHVTALQIYIYTR
jgi:hypothetical protein